MHRGAAFWTVYMYIESGSYKNYTRTTVTHRYHFHCNFHLSPGLNDTDEKMERREKLKNLVKGVKDALKSST